MTSTVFVQPVLLCKKKSSRGLCVVIAMIRKGHNRNGHCIADFVCFVSEIFLFIIWLSAKIYIVTYVDHVTFVNLDNA